MIKIAKKKKKKSIYKRLLSFLPFIRQGKKKKKSKKKKRSPPNELMIPAYVLLGVIGIGALLEFDRRTGDLDFVVSIVFLTFFVAVWLEVNIIHPKPYKRPDPDNRPFNVKVRDPIYNWGLQTDIYEEWKKREPYWQSLREDGRIYVEKRLNKLGYEYLEPYGPHKMVLKDGGVAWDNKNKREYRKYGAGDIIHHYEKERSKTSTKIKNL